MKPVAKLIIILLTLISGYYFFKYLSNYRPPSKKWLFPDQNLETTNIILNTKGSINFDQCLNPESYLNESNTCSNELSPLDKLNGCFLMDQLLTYNSTNSDSILRIIKDTSELASLIGAVCRLKLYPYAIKSGDKYKQYIFITTSDNPEEIPRALMSLGPNLEIIVASEVAIPGYLFSPADIITIQVTSQAYEDLLQKSCDGALNKSTLYITNDLFNNQQIGLLTNNFRSIIFIPLIKESVVEFLTPYSEMTYKNLSLYFSNLPIISYVGQLPEKTQQDFLMLQLRQVKLDIGKLKSPNLPILKLKTSNNTSPTDLSEIEEILKIFKNPHSINVLFNNLPISTFFLENKFTYIQTTVKKNLLELILKHPVKHPDCFKIYLLFAKNSNVGELLNTLFYLYNQGNNTNLNLFSQKNINQDICANQSPEDCKNVLLKKVNTLCNASTNCDFSFIIEILEKECVPELIQYHTSFLVEYLRDKIKSIYLEIYQSWEEKIQSFPLEESEKHIQGLKQTFYSHKHKFNFIEHMIQELQTLPYIEYIQEQAAQKLALIEKVTQIYFGYWHISYPGLITLEKHGLEVKLIPQSNPKFNSESNIRNNINDFFYRKKSEQPPTGQTEKMDNTFFPRKT